MKTKRKYIKDTAKFTSKNGVNLVGQSYRQRDYAGRMRTTWEINRTDTKGLYDSKYVDSMSDSIGKMYSTVFPETPESFETYIALWKKRYVLPDIRNGHFRKASSYMLDLHLECDMNSESFDRLVQNTGMLLDAGEIVEYNDEHGVGSFHKTSKKGKYKARHCRWGTSRDETLDLDGVRAFLRSFFRVGYCIEQAEVW